MPRFDPDRLSLSPGRGRTDVYQVLYKCRLERLEKLERRLEELGVDDPSKVTSQMLRDPDLVPEEEFKALATVWAKDSVEYRKASEDTRASYNNPLPGVLKDVKECLEEAVDKGHSRLLALYGLHMGTKEIDLLVRSRAQREFWPNRGLRREPIGIFFLTIEHRKAVQWLEPLAELDGLEVLPINSVEDIPNSLRPNCHLVLPVYAGGPFPSKVLLDAKWGHWVGFLDRRCVCGWSSGPPNEPLTVDAVQLPDRCFLHLTSAPAINPPTWLCERYVGHVLTLD